MMVRVTAWLRRTMQARKIRASALFDAAWYRRSYRDLGPGVDAALHYIANGAAEGRDPGPGFSTSGYRMKCAEAGENLGDENPLLHFERRRVVNADADGSWALPSFAGTQTGGAAPTVLFVAHQAVEHVFGAERSLSHMLDRAGQAGLCVEVVIPQVLNSGYLDALRARSRRVHVRPFGWRFGDDAPDASAVKAIAALIQQSGAVEVHQNTAVLDAPLLASRLMQIPSVVYLRELPAEDADLCSRLGMTADRLRDKLLAEADRFVANSDAVARWIAPADPQRCLTLPNSIAPDLFDLPFHPQTPLRVGMISSNIAKKGLADFLQVARLCEDCIGRPAPFRFVLIGPDSPDLQRSRPLPELVTHLGYAKTPTQAVVQVDILLSLSQFAESFGRTVYEALAAGRPVICYDRGTPPDLLGRTSVAGHVVKANTPRAVADALAHYADNSAAVQAASLAARLRAQEIRGTAAGVTDRQLFLGAYHQWDGVPQSDPP